MKKMLPFVLLFLFLSLAGCSLQDHELYKYNQLLPLDIGNSWTYQVTRHDGFNDNDRMTVTSTMKDTIRQSESIKNFWVATIESVSSAETLLDVQGNYPATNMLMPAHTENYWLIVDDNRVIRQEQNLNLDNLQNQTLVELVFPMELGNKWSMTNSQNAPLDNEVKKVGSIEVPAGEFSGCFYTEGAIGGATFGVWLCPGIGIVQRNVEHQGTPFGYEQELTSYKVK